MHAASTIPRPADVARFVALLPALDGYLTTPEDPRWNTARSAWQLAVDQRPAGVVHAASSHDVISTVRTAAAAGLRVAPQGTGHNALPLGPLDHTILLRTDEMNGIDVDWARRTARVQAGAVWGEVTDSVARHGLAALAGSARDVGVVGYTLGGGLSWFARSHGLAANHVTAAEVVTADGILRRVDATHHADLFWAIRGGGGSFGIVTALEFRLFPITQVTAGALFWPIQRAPEVLHTWREWLREVPETVTTIGRLLRFPPAPQIPEPMRGRSLVTVELVSQLDVAATDALLAPLRALGPEMDTVAPTPVTDLGDLHMDPPAPTPATGDGMLLADLQAEALDAYLDTAAAAGPSLLTTELRHLGGALTPGRTPAGAVSGIDAAFAVYSGGITPDPESAGRTRTALAALEAALAPWNASTGYLNFTEHRAEGAALFDPAVHRRLREIKTAYDPTDLIHANHPVLPLPS